MNAAQVLDCVNSIAPEFDAAEGIQWGDQATAISGVLVTWMADRAAIQHALERRCNFILTHEDITSPPGYARRDAPFTQHGWRANRARLDLIAEHGVVVARCHNKIDRFSIVDAFAERCGFGQPDLSNGLLRIYTCEPPRRLGDLAAQVKRAMQMETVRVLGDDGVLVHRIGNAVGGIGLSLNEGFMEMLLVAGADCLVAGEMDEYATLYAIDSGLTVIETSHMLSENPGLQIFADELNRVIGGAPPVHFYAMPLGWRYA